MKLRPYFTRFFCSAWIAAAFSSPIAAEEVLIDYGPLKLLGDFEEAEEPIETVALITHGTLAHKDMELIEALQNALSERGVSSLAHTLSLGVSERRGMYDCAIDHIHKDEDADGEIGLWIDWLKKHGHLKIALVGHSRGGKQVARAATARDDFEAAILMAPATKTSSEKSRSGYADRFGASLTEILASAKDMDESASLDVPGLLYCPATRARAGTLLSYYDGETSGAESYAGKIGAPVLVIAAGEDDVVPGVAEAFGSLVDASLTLETVEDADHLFLDFYTEDAADLIAAFLTKGDSQSEELSEEQVANADLEYGEYLGQECLACHVPNGAEGVPGIAGQNAIYLHRALGEYAQGEREHATMRMIARSLDDEQRIAISAYFASLTEY